MPKISVLTATYNRSDVLGRAMESLQNQTFEDYEHLIVDDGSTDDTAAVVADHADERVRYLDLDRNCGPAAAWNRGIRAARGEYVAFLDSDDEYLPRHLAVTTDVLDDEPESVAGVATSYEQVADGVSVQSVPDGKITFDRLTADNVICGSSNTMYRTPVFDDVGYFDETFPAEVDYDFQLRVLDEFCLVGIDELLVRKYERADSVQRDAEKKSRGVTLLLEKHGERLSDNRTAQKYREIGDRYLSTGAHTEATRYFEKALTVCPDQLVWELEHRIGRNYLLAGYKRAGRRHLKRSMRLNPTQYRPYALILISLVPGDFEQSLERARAIRDVRGGIT